MKTTFKFYFLLIIGTAVLSALVYGLAGTMVEKNITTCSFSLMAITVICLAGMMKTLTLVPADQK
jgi:hypothetical protein